MQHWEPSLFHTSGVSWTCRERDSVRNSQTSCRKWWLTACSISACWNQISGNISGHTRRAWKPYSWAKESWVRLLGNPWVVLQRSSSVKAEYQSHWNISWEKPREVMYQGKLEVLSGGRKHQIVIWTDTKWNGGGREKVGHLQTWRTKLIAQKSQHAHCFLIFQSKCEPL